MPPTAMKDHTQRTNDVPTKKFYGDCIDIWHPRAILHCRQAVGAYYLIYLALRLTLYIRVDGEHQEQRVDERHGLNLPYKLPEQNVMSDNILTVSVPPIEFSGISAEYYKYGIEYPTC